MPRFLDQREIESCLAHTEARDVSLDGPVTVALVHRLGRQGSLQYFPDFPRPYFRIDHATAWLVQGIIGSTRLRIQLFGDDRAAVLAELRRSVEADEPSHGTTEESP